MATYARLSQGSSHEDVPPEIQENKPQGKGEVTSVEGTCHFISYWMFQVVQHVKPHTKKFGVICGLYILPLPT